MYKKLVIISGFFLLLLHTNYAQTLDIKDKKILIDGVKLFEIKKDKVIRNSFYLNDINGKQRLYFRYVYWSDDKPSYYEAYHANALTTILFEEEYRGNFKRYIVKKLFNADVITILGIDEEKLKIVTQKIGKEFTRRRTNEYELRQ